jgi:hypothetical protein
MARLVFYRIGDEPPMELYRANLTAALFTCGSGARNDLSVPDRAVPVQQFGILQVGRSWRHKDLSGRGTKVRGELVKHARLVNGSRIRVSRWYAIFEVDATDKDD